MNLWQPTLLRIDLSGTTAVSTSLDLHHFNKSLRPAGSMSPGNLLRDADSRAPPWTLNLYLTSPPGDSDPAQNHWLTIILS